MKLGVVGFGRIGKMHSKNINASHPGFLKTIVSHNSDRTSDVQWLKQNNISGVHIVDDINAITSDNEITAVIIAASTSAHVEIIETLLPSKKHLFCEKPVSLSSKVLASLAKKIKDAGIVFQVGFNRRFDHNYNEIKKAVANGDVGKLHIIKIKNRDPERPPLSFIPKSGGLILDFNTHDFDMLRYISGEEINEVVALGSNMIDPKIGELGDIDTALIMLRFTNGTIAVIDTSRETNYGYDQELEVFGQNGSIKAMNLRENTLIRSLNNEVNISKPKDSFVTRYADAYALQTKLFLDTIENENLNQAATKNSKKFIIALPTINDTLAAVCIAEAVNKSLKSKKIEKVQYEH